MWNALARIVFEAKSGLSFRVSLYGKRTKEAEFGHAVASPICRTCVIERPGTRRTFERGHHKTMQLRPRAVIIAGLDLYQGDGTR